MPKGSEALAKARRDEIINACAELYETMGFRDITIRDIAAKTSFTRTSIYNYFQTKEEIFLALLGREYEAWTADMRAMGGEEGPAAFAGKLAATLQKRGCMLKLISMNLYDMEGSSRLENLVEFKRIYAAARGELAACLARSFPGMPAGEIEEFIRCFLPFLFGVYPYTTATGKQREAMELAGVEYAETSVYELTRAFTERLLG